MASRHVLKPFQEEVLVFYPKLELNFIEHSVIKHWLRDNCQVTIHGLRKNLPTRILEISPHGNY
jgi:hypothetical protein